MTRRKYVYRDFVGTLSDHFTDRLKKIGTIYNFDFGDEFEVALCEALAGVLPPQFGVCRGHVIDREGNDEGDDILIFDRMLFPTLRLIVPGNFSRKEWVPIEAVYVYIEAKHGLAFDCSGKGGKPVQDTIVKALSQVRAVKDLCNTRAPTWKKKIGPFGMTDGRYLQANRMYTAIVARCVYRKNKRVNAPEQVASLLKDHIAENDRSMPDMIIAGESNIVLPGQEVGIAGLPMLDTVNTGEIDTKLHQVTVPGTAFGIGLCVLLEVIRRIRLGEVSLIDIINDGLSPGPLPAPHIDREPPHKKPKHKAY